MLKKVDGRGLPQKERREGTIHLLKSMVILPCCFFFESVTTGNMFILSRGLRQMEGTLSGIPFGANGWFRARLTPRQWEPPTYGSFLSGFPLKATKRRLPSKNDTPGMLPTCQQKVAMTILVAWISSRLLKNMVVGQHLRCLFVDAYPSTVVFLEGILGVHGFDP